MPGLAEERSKYIKLLKDTEGLTPEQRSLAAESFTEGWVQCELYLKRNPDAKLS